MSSLEHNTVTIWDFYRVEAEEQLALIPRRPGLYVWTYNLGRLLGLDVMTANEKLLNLLALVGRQQTNKVGPYVSVTVRDERKRINPRKAVVLHDCLSCKDDHGSWLAEMATEVQRPIYIGMTHNLNRRINDHLEGRTGLRGRVEDADAGFTVKMLDLAVSWWSPPVSSAQADAAQTLVEPGDLETGTIEEGVTDSLEPDKEDTGTDPELDRFLKASESLLIRMAMPMFNEKQD